jgi:hypothetical protein
MPRQVTAVAEGITELWQLMQPTAESAYSHSTTQQMPAAGPMGKKDTSDAHGYNSGIC